MTAVPGPDPLVTPLAGGLVLVGPRGSRCLLRAVRAAERDARRDGWIPPDLLALRAALEVAAEQTERNTAEHAEFRPSPGVPSSAPSSSSTVRTGLIGTREAAGLLGCTDRNVRALCGRGVFDSATRRAGIWWVDRFEVETRVMGTASPPRSGRSNYAVRQGPAVG